MLAITARFGDPVAQARLGDPEVLGDVLDPDTGLTVQSDPDDVVAELLRIRLGHGEHPSSGTSRHHRSDVTSPRGSPIFAYGTSGDLPVVGDWDKDNVDTVGFYRPGSESWYLTNTNASVSADYIYGSLGIDGGRPLAGDWDGDGLWTVGGYKSSNDWVEYDPGVTASSVTYDATGRVLTAVDPTLRTTTTVWDSAVDRKLYTDDPAGLRSSVVYSPEGRVTDNYGPAPTSCFSGQTPNGSCATPPVPRTHTNYDEGLTSLASTWWTNSSISGAPVLHATGVPDPSNNTTIDGGTINHTWSTASPSTAIASPDNWSVRFTGDITFPATGAFTLGSNYNGGLRLFIDDVKIFEDWSDTGVDKNVNNVVYTASDTLPHRIRVEYTDTVGSARLELHWTGPGTVWQIVPASALHPRYGLTTSTIESDTDNGPTTQRITSTGYAQPETGLATVTSVDWTGVNLRTTTTYETGTTGYHRLTSRSMPADAAINPTSALTAVGYSYYGATQTLSSPPCGTGAPNQAGLLQTTTQADPDGAGSATAIVRSQTYDDAGRVTGTHIGSEPFTCTTYDTRGRVVQVSYPAYGAGAARTVTTDYTGDATPTAWNDGGNPLIATVNDSAGTISTTVDLLGRVVSYTDVHGKTTTTTYDNAGRASTTVGPAGTMAVRYDPAGRVLQQWLDGTRVAQATYDNYGRFSTAAYGNGVWLSALTTGAGYDNFGRPTMLQWNMSASTRVTDALTRSQSGRVIDQSIDLTDPYTGGNNFTYDGAGRLTAARASGHSYAYGFANTSACILNTAGADSNRTTYTDNGVSQANYCYDYADRLVSASGTAGVTGIAYDSHGNMSTINGETHAYDAADRHLSTTKSGTTVTYTRDAFDRIIARTDAAGTIKYSYSASGDTGDAVLDNAGNVTQRTIPLLGGVLLTAGSTGLTGSTWSFPNVHGDVIAITDNTGVKQNGPINYDPFGNLIGGTLPDNSADDFDYGWLGQHQRPLEHDAAFLPTIEMGARQYSPLLGRFLEVDPIEGGSANDYDYVSADPINHFDLDGRCESAAAWCVIGILRGTESLPGMFRTWANRRAGHSYQIGWNGSRRYFAGGGCSAPMMGNTGRSFNFTRACQTHDLGYDLMRFFGSSGSRGGTRRAVDALFGRDLVSHCGGRSIFLRPTCYAWADTYHTVVDINSMRQAYRVP
jgi:RHS repeat-associated protein